ncbi:MAG: hypothetical protein PHU85_17330 [Phycisphaerae bacterium]|nr:hypothetical protein [Phycisphaerae bacterium]
MLPLKKFEKDNLNLTHYRTLQSQLQALEPYADKPQFAEKVSGLRAAIKTLGEIKPEDIDRYAKRREELVRVVDAAREVVAAAAR